MKSTQLLRFYGGRVHGRFEERWSRCNRFILPSRGLCTPLTPRSGSICLRNGLGSCRTTKRTDLPNVERGVRERELARADDADAPVERGVEQEPRRPDVITVHGARVFWRGGHILKYVASALGGGG